MQDKTHLHWLDNQIELKQIFNSFGYSLSYVGIQILMTVFILYSAENFCSNLYLTELFSD